MRQYLLASLTAVLLTASLLSAQVPTATLTGPDGANAKFGTQWLSPLTAAGVTQTKPATAPEQKPRTLGLPLMAYSAMAQTKEAIAVASVVVVNAFAAMPSAALISQAITRPGWYWSSSSGGANYAQVQRFSDGEQIWDFKDDPASLRCVRG